MSMMEYFMMKLQEILANMDSFLGETVEIEMEGTKTELFHFCLILDNPFFKNTMATKNKITVEFHTAEELMDKIYDFENYRRSEKYYMEKPLKEDTIIDEEQSVRWNREEVARRNEEIERRLKNDRKYHQLCDSAMEEIIKTSVNSWYMTEFNKETINVIYAQAWESGHSYGYSEVYNHFREYMDMFVDACKAAGYINE